MKKTKDVIFMFAAILLSVLLFCVKLTGETGHVIISVMLIIACVSHICKQMVKMKCQKKEIRIVDEVLLAALVGIFATGMLMHPLEGAWIFLGIKILHKLTGMIFVLGIFVHILQHRKGKKEKERSIHVS